MKTKIKKRKIFRPIELVHDFNFIPCHLPQDIPLPSPTDRLDNLKALGYGGVAISPSYTSYLSEESFKKTAEIIRYAKKIGLSVWIYDEKYYPSGSADGSVVREHPEYEAKALAALTATPDEHGIICINSPHGYSSVLYAFACDTDSCGNPLFDTLRDVSTNKTFGGGILLDCKSAKDTVVYAFFGKSAFEFCTTSHNTRGIRRYIDTLNPKATKDFLTKTYSGYAQLGNLSGFIDAAFTDEPQIPALCRTSYRKDYLSYVKSLENGVFTVQDTPDERIAFSPYMPWTEKLPDSFKKQHGYELIPSLPRIFFDESYEGEKMRTAFWDTVSMLFAVNFSKVYSDFCNEIGIAYSGHFLAEETFENHPYLHGDILLQLGMMDIPGCDMLYATPEQIMNHASAIKLAASAAELYDKDDVMIEASNIARDIFPITEASLKLATALEAALGATKFLSYYTETCINGDAMRRCCDFTERLLSTLSDTKPSRKVYVFLPNREIEKECYPSVSVSEKRPLSSGLTKIKSFLRDGVSELLYAGIDFCYINEERICAIDTFIANNAALVIPPNVCPPALSDKFANVIRESTAVDTVKRLRQLGYANVEPIEPASIVSLKKCSDDTEAFLLVNIGDDYFGQIELNTEKKTSTVTVYDPDTNKSSQNTLSNNRITLSLEKYSCRIIFIKNNVSFI